MFRKMMSFHLVFATVMCATLEGTAFAKSFEIKMLNKGADGARMVFEPDFVHIQPGDTVKFIATDKSHNAELKKGMSPEGAKIFKGKVNEEIEVTFEVRGLYGVICKPHFAMGMVMTIAVGDDVAAPESMNRSPRVARRSSRSPWTQLKN